MPACWCLTVFNLKAIFNAFQTVIVTNAEVGHATLLQLQLSSIIAIEPAIEKIPTYLVFNKQKNLSTELRSFNKALKEIMADGSARKIRNKYLHLPAGGQ